MSLRKAALLFLSTLTVPWSRPPTPPQLSEAFRAFLLGQALPSILSDLTDPACLSVSDAATHNLIPDVGALLWTVATSFGPQACADALGAALHPQAGGLLRVPWQEQSLAALLSAVASPGAQINAFKDQFRKFVKQIAPQTQAQAQAQAQAR